MCEVLPPGAPVSKRVNLCVVCRTQFWSDRRAATCSAVCRQELHRYRVKLRELRSGGLTDDQIEARASELVRTMTRGSRERRAQGHGRGPRAGVRTAEERLESFLRVLRGGPLLERQLPLFEGMHEP